MMDMAQDTQTTTQWYLVQIKPNSYRIAMRNLEQQGFLVFNPVHEELRRYKSKLRSELRPLFPGYMFVSFNPDSAPWRAINSTYGVSNIVTLGQSSPKAVPAQFMEGLLARCNANGQLSNPALLQSGDKVRVISGPFSDFISNVEHVAADKRVWVLVDILGGLTKVTIDMDNLQKL